MSTPPASEHRASCNLSPQRRGRGKLPDQQISCFWLASEHLDDTIAVWVRPVQGFAGDGARNVILRLRKPRRLLLLFENQNLETSHEALIAADKGSRSRDECPAGWCEEAGGAQGRSPR